MMVDSEQLPTTYDKWLYLAEKTERRLKREGHLVERAYIDPEEFPSWCGARGMNMDASARTAFATEFVDGQYRDQS